MRFTLSSFGLIAFDHRFKALPETFGGLFEPDDFSTALDNVQAAANRRLYNLIWRYSEKVSWQTVVDLGARLTRTRAGHSKSSHCPSESGDDPSRGVRHHRPKTREAEGWQRDT